MAREIDISDLKRAIESQHGGTATFVQSVPVRDTFQGQPAWQGTVGVFDLEGHPKATMAYAWTRELLDGKKRTYAVLHIAPVKGPQDAVRAAIVAEQRRANACPRCGGIGMIDETPHAKHQPKPSPQECPECRGTGARSRIAT